MMIFAVLAVPLLEAGNGVKVGPPVLVAHGDAPSGAVDRIGALATWRDHGCIEIARLAGDATPGKPVQLGCGATGAPRAASSGDVTLVVWPAGGELAGALVTPELHVTALRPRGEHPVAVTTAYDGTRFLVTTASCTAADLLVFDRAGTATARTVLKTSKPHDDLFVSGAVVACEGSRCDAAYSIANSTIPIAGGCQEQIRKPRWAASYTAPVTAGVPGAFAVIDSTDESRATYPTKLMITRHGLAWALSRFVQRHDTAIGAFGTLDATTTYESELWNGRERVTQDRVQIELVPNDPKVAHHAPLAVPGETSPDVLALPGDHFVLLTQARDGVVARAIAIDPAWFTHPPQARGPVLTGRLRASNKKPPAMPRIGCLLRTGTCGESTIHEDGTFVVPVADPFDFRVAAQADAPPIIAYAGGDEYWFTPAQRETRADIQLAAAAHIIGTAAWPGGKPPHVAPMPVEREEYGPHAGDVIGPTRDPLELSFQAHALLPVIAPYEMAGVTSMYSYGLHADGTFDVPVAATGRALLVAQTADHEYGATAWVKTEPGKSVHLTLPLKKTATLTVRVKGQPWTVGDDMRLASAMCATDGRGCTFEHIAPGPQWLSVTTPDWSMTRMLDVAPGENKTLELPFVPDLAPGDTGVHVSRAIDGITVTAIAPGGPAAGLLAPDDVIVAIDGKAVGTDLAAAIATLRGAPDSRVEVTVIRGRRAQKLTLTRTHGTPAP